MRSLSSALRGLPPGIRAALQYAFSGLLTVLFLYLAFRGIDAGQLVASLAAANYWWILLNLAILLASHLLRAWRWRYLLEPVKPGISLRNLYSGVMVGYMMNNVLPRAGEIARPYAIGKLEGVSKSTALGTIVVERLMDMLSFLVLVAMIPLLYDGPLRESFPWLERAGVVTLAVVVPTVALLIALMLRRDWTDALLRVAARVLPERASRHVERLLHSFLDGLLWLKRPGRFLIIGVLSVLVWFCYGLMTYVALFAFGIEPPVGFAGSFVVLAISSIGVAIPTPGATGSYHAFTSQTLIRLFAVEPAVALSFATATHAAGFVGSTAVGLYFFFRDRLTVAEAVRPGERPAA